MIDREFWQTPQRIRDIRAQFRLLANERLPMHWLDGLLLHILDEKTLFLHTDSDYLLSLAQMQQLDAGMQRLFCAEPLAYLIGKQGFWRDEFIVNHATLIPRADTERLVEVALNFAQNLKKAGRLLDLGTGTGCVGISLAKELADWAVVLADFSTDALDVAKQNIKKLNATNAQAVHSDWYSSIEGHFDIIVANPPYIADDDTHLAALVAEPMSALVADNHGLADIMQIILGAHKHLRAGGLLAIEHGYDQAQQVADLFVQAGFEQVRSVQDLGGNDRITLGIAPVWR